jgi:hypothetical protein
MPHPRVAADENELLEGRRLSALFQEPEHALDRHVHDVGRRLLASGQMHHVRRARHRAGHIAALRHRTLHHLQPLAFFQQPIVAEGADSRALPGCVCHKAANEVLPNLAGSAGNQDDLAFLHDNSGSLRARLP